MAPAQNSLRFGIIGAGMLGLSLAYRLRQLGHDVTIIEASGALGGQTSTWKLGDVTWDRHYHVISPQDSHLLKLLGELGLSEELVWRRTKTGFYAQGRLYSMSNIIEFLRFPVLSLVDKFRLGLTILRASTLSDISRYEQETSVSWLNRWSGKRTTENLWTPLLQSKFSSQYRILSAAFIISTIQRMYGARQGEGKQEMFGYVRGGYETILNRLHQRLVDMQVSIRLSSPVKSITSQDAGISVEMPDGQRHRFDRVVITTAAPLVAQLCPQLPEAEKQRYGNLPYLGIVCASMLTQTPLSNYYVTNIVDPSVPFTGIIEMSALVDRQEFSGYSLVYLPRYAESGDSLFMRSDEELKEQYFSVLEKMYPHFKRSDVRAFQVSRLRYVMPIPTPEHQKHSLPVRTSCPGVFTLGTGNITEGVLTVNKVMSLAEQALPDLL
jgi:protoporphyrinogen oxidase